MKNKALIKNFLSVLVPTILALLIHQVLNLFIESKDAFYVIFILALFCLIMNLIYSFLCNKPEFTGAMLVGTVLKLLMALVGIFIYSIMSPNQFKNFSIQVIVFYILFTIFEIKFLLFLISSQTKK